MQDERKNAKQNEKKDAAILKHSIQLAEIPLQGFTAKEINLFWGLLLKIHDQIESIDEIKDDQIIRASVKYSELRSVLGIKRRGNSSLNSELQEMAKKFSNINLAKEYRNGFSIVHPFADFEGDGDYLTFGVHPKIAMLLHGLDGSPGKLYTLTDVIGISKMKSTFSKECLKMLFFRGKILHGDMSYWSTSVESLRYYLSIPEGYRSGDIKRRVIDVIISEFSESGIFDSFEVIEKKEAGSDKVGRKKTVGYTFKFSFSARYRVNENRNAAEGDAIICPKCGKPLVKRARRDGAGYFLGHKDGHLKNAACKYTKSLIEVDGVVTDIADAPSEENADVKVSEAKLSRYYRFIRESEVAAEEERREYIRVNEPEIWEKFEARERCASDFVSQIGIFISDSARDYLRDEMNKATEALNTALEERGYEKDYLELRYRCAECKDTGQRDDGMFCSCRKERAEEAAIWKENG